MKDQKKTSLLDNITVESIPDLLSSEPEGSLRAQFEGTKDEDTDVKTKEELEAEAAAKDTPDTPNPKQDPEPEPDTPNPEETTNDTDTDTDQANIFEAIAEEMGYELETEFEPTVEGFAAFSKQLGNKIASDNLAEIFEKLPDVKEYTEYRIMGGRKEDFFRAEGEVDLEGVEITEDDVSSQKAIITRLYKERGFSNARTVKMIGLLEESESLHEEAVSALEELKQLYGDRKTQLIQKQQQDYKRQMEQDEAHWNKVKDLITSGDVAGISIPEADKSKFFQWLSSPVKDGMSQRAIDRQQLDTAQLLTLEYLIFKGFDLGKIASSVKKSRQVTLGLKKGSPQGSRMGGAGKDSSRDKAIDKIPDLEKIL